MAESFLPIIESGVEETVEDTSSSTSKKRSQIYQYFTYKLLRWTCNHCLKDFFDKATSALWRHINKVHLKLVEHEKVKEGNG